MAAMDHKLRQRVPRLLRQLHWSVVHGLDELNGRAELGPPVGCLALKPVLIEGIDKLHRGEEVRGIGLHQDEDEHRHEVVCGGDSSGQR